MKILMDGLNIVRMVVIVLGLWSLCVRLGSIRCEEDDANAFRELKSRYED